MSWRCWVEDPLDMWHMHLTFRTAYWHICIRSAEFTRFYVASNAVIHTYLGCIMVHRNYFSSRIIDKGGSIHGVAQTLQVATEYVSSRVTHMNFLQIPHFWNDLHNKNNLCALFPMFRRLVYHLSCYKWFENGNGLWKPPICPTLTVMDTSWNCGLTIGGGCFIDIIPSVDPWM